MLIAAAFGAATSAQAQSAHAHSALKAAIEDTRFPILVPNIAGDAEAPSGSFGSAFYSGSGCTTEIIENYPPMNGKDAYNRKVVIDWKKVASVFVDDTMPGWIAIQTAKPDQLEYFYLRGATASHPAIAEIQAACAPSSAHADVKPERTAAIREMKSILDAAAVPLYEGGKRVPGANGKWLVYGGGCITGIESRLPAYTVDGVSKAADNVVVVHYWREPITVSLETRNPDYVLLRRPTETKPAYYYAGSADKARRLHAAMTKLSNSCLAGAGNAAPQAAVETGRWTGKYDSSYDVCVLEFAFPNGKYFGFEGDYDGLYLLTDDPRALAALRGTGKVSMTFSGGGKRAEIPDRINSSATASVIEAFLTMSQEDQIWDVIETGQPLTVEFTGSPASNSGRFRLPAVDGATLKSFHECYG